jgi:hypothetical protein
MLPGLDFEPLPAGKENRKRNEMTPSLNSLKIAVAFASASNEEISATVRPTGTEVE